MKHVDWCSNFGSELWEVQAKFGLHSGEGGQSELEATDVIRILWLWWCCNGRCGWLWTRRTSTTEIHIQNPLEDLVCKKCEAKLWCGSKHSSWAAFPERWTTFLLQDLPCCIWKGVVNLSPDKNEVLTDNSTISSLSSSSGYLKSSFDHIGRCDQVCCGHTYNKTNRVTLCWYYTLEPKTNRQSQQRATTSRHYCGHHHPQISAYNAHKWESRWRKMEYLEGSKPLSPAEDIKWLIYHHFDS